MNHGLFTYSLLRYIHSQVLGEVVNVGILFIFPEQQRILFKYPTRLYRLKSLYHGLSERHIKNYLHGFERKSRQINKQWSLFADQLIQSTPNKFIATEFLPSDDSALQFDEVKTGVLYSSDVDKVANDFYQSFFSNYQTVDQPKEKHDEEYVLKTYKRLLYAKNTEIDKYLRPGITVESDSVSLKSDLVWQNGTTNLVKSVGFDLLDAENINRKSLEYFGRLNFLTDLANKEHYRFDLLVSKPQDRHLYSAYEKALDILRSSHAPKVIVEEQEFERYTVKTVEEMVIQ